MEKLTDVELSSVVLEESKSRSWGKEQTNSVIVQVTPILFSCCLVVRITFCYCFLSVYVDTAESHHSGTAI